MTSHGAGCAPAALLSRFGLSGADRIGSGAESEVFALDAERVLRIWRPGTALAKVERRQSFLRRLDRSAVSFALPEILEVQRDADGWIRSVERRIRGASLDAVLPSLRGGDRVRALESFAEAASEIALACEVGPLFGDLLSEDRVESNSWVGYLDAKLRVIEPRVRPHLVSVGIDVDAVLGELEAGIVHIDDVDRPRLVHGDYFPGNVMISEDLTVSGVVDLSAHTLAGDPRLDLAGAVVQLDVFDTHEPGDRRIVREAICRRQPDVSELLDLYGRWWAVYYSQWSAPGLLRWAARVLDGVPLPDALK